MTYQRWLKPWSIVRLNSALHRWSTIGRYQMRSEAEASLQMYRRLFPSERFELVFELE
ncbi:hypothetical protein [Leptolyngbya sp. NIES-2104]|uniref:hypothetical protein n=1 Tax=Leptolyngbya sp. NIES-2104 TaxID=1552121 RepID=UPI0006EC8DA2|nr:hypothetical protein [Leptolyngbya sp. NIES-2104]GAP93620.1 hypothetical protein NIES2104_01270 [Leptolyngbya sp. NIES-2104]